MRLLWNYINRFVTSEYLALLLRVVIGVMFIVAAMSKFIYPAEFAENLAAYRIMPYWSINFIAVLMPWLEMICGLFLIIGLMTRSVSAMLTVFLFGFTVFVAINVLRGTPISCGCFDSVGQEISWKKVFMDLSLMLLALQIFFYDRRFQILRQRRTSKRQEKG
jgi:putative oxidoreductase